MGRRVQITLNEYIDGKACPNFRNMKMSIFKLRRNVTHFMPLLYKNIKNVRCPVNNLVDNLLKK